jgi:predicted nuclease of restriction endonuclease-like (RecB) superfamily
MIEKNTLPNAASDRFDEVLDLIRTAKLQAVQAVNIRLIELYWQVGAYISRKLESSEWGDSVIVQLAQHIALTHPGLRGFTRPNLFRMRQFYDAYWADEKVSPLVRQLPWTHNLIILSQSRRPEEREFYLRMAFREKWSKRELERQFKAGLFERSITQPANLCNRFLHTARHITRRVFNLKSCRLSTHGYTPGPSLPWPWGSG